MRDVVYVDLEICKNPTAPEVGGWDNTHKMGTSCAVIYEEKFDRLGLYGDRPEELEALRARLLEAELVIGYNLWNFDLLVLYELPRKTDATPIDREQVYDLLQEIWQAIPDRYENGWKLGDVAAATIGRAKGGDGADAIALHKAGQVGRLLTYCLQDVRLLVELVRFVRRYGYVCHGATGRQVRVARAALIG